jgi:peptidoglycan/LPS O-acetylase OafA/YrhL
VLGQLTIVQFYNPDFMRLYGTGVLNGSVWTIAIELQFYALVPVLYVMLRKRMAVGRGTNALLLALCAVFALLNRLYVLHAPLHTTQLWFKFLSVSFLPWFYMFLTGVLFQRNYQYLSTRLAGKLLPVTVGYCLLAIIGYQFFGWNLGNTMSAPLFLALAILVFSGAFSYTTLSDRLLRRNDVSYGVYIFHMPVVNCLLTFGFVGLTGFLLAAATTLACACLSWVFVEKPVLALKKHTLYSHEATRAAGARCNGS